MVSVFVCDVSGRVFWAELGQARRQNWTLLQQILDRLHRDRA